MSKLKLCQPHELRAKLLDLLRDGPSTSDSLARLTGYSGDAVRKRLTGLRVSGYVTHKNQSRENGGMSYIWTLSSSAAQLPALPMFKPAKEGTDRLHQKTVKDFAPFHHRDSLVAAFFGPAHKEAA